MKRFGTFILLSLKKKKNHNQLKGGRLYEFPVTINVFQKAYLNVVND